MASERFEIGKKKHRASSDQGGRASWNTPRHSSRSGLSYGTRMAATFALTSLMSVLILVGVVTVVWSGVFSDYTRNNMEDIAKSAALRLAEAYEEDGEWSTAFLSSIADDTLSSDIGLQVSDAEGTILYDDTWPAAALVADVDGDREEDADASDGSTEDSADAEAEAGDASEQDEDDDGAQDAAGDDAAPAPVNVPMGSDDARPHRSHSFTSTAPTDAAASVTEPVVTSSGETVGTVRIWVLGSDVLLSNADNAFRERTFNAMTLAAVIAVCISLVAGYIFSRMLTNPIRKITRTAKQLRDGDWSARTGLVGDDEIDRLGETFDEMATSLERDLKHEKRITSDVAHELRTPLMGMLATVEAMQDGVMPADEEHLETVASETRRLARLVQQMLDLSRMETKTTPMNVEEVDMVPFVQRIVTGQHQLFHDRDLRLRFTDETQGRDATCECDPDMVTQAIINIMSNAMRYTPEGGWVVVSVAADRKEVSVAVSDTGIGIAKEDLSRIFSRFWRADASRAREAGGLGVGLALTKQIVERHQGYISVDSELGKGTTFTIHLPREHTPETPSSTMVD